MGNLFAAATEAAAEQSSFFVYCGDPSMAGGVKADGIAGLSAETFSEPDKKTPVLPEAASVGESSSGYTGEMAKMELTRKKATPKNVDRTHPLR